MKYNEEIIAQAVDLCGAGCAAAAITDSEGIYIYVNNIWQSITGISSEEIIGKNIRSFPNIEGSCADAAINTAHNLVSIVRVKGKKGGEKRSEALLVRYRPLRDIKGNVTGCFISQLCSGKEEALGINRQIERFLAESGEKGKKKNKKNQVNRAKYTVDSIIGGSSPMQEVKRQIYIAAATSASCLIEGETGTGKELVAHAIHNAGSRKEEPFVRVNCSAIPENLMESEFFGYEEGSFTGSAKGGKIGKFESANHGTMFLDEINAMDLTMQPKLLRALQEKEIERVGGTVSIPVDVRILSASNHPLEELIENGKFRRDLFYRLNIITINIPPLRERKDDIPLLTESFIETFRNSDRGNAIGITEKAMEYLMEYSWPGNVRELQNTIERAMASTMSEILDINHFQKLENRSKSTSYTGRGSHADYTGRTDYANHTLANRAEEENSVNSANSVNFANSVEIQRQSSLIEKRGAKALSDMEEENEKAAIIDALRKSNLNKSKTAQLLNISRTLLYKKLDKYGIDC